MNFEKNNLGYTLIELIVSVAILSIMTSIILANYHGGATTSELDIAAQDLVSEIRKVQSYALSYKEYNGTIQSQGGWGIRLTDEPAANPENLVLFFDINNSGKYDSATEYFFEKPIGKNVYVSSLIFDGTPATNSYLWAIYYPPDPKIMLRGDNNATSINDFDYGDSTTSADNVVIVLTHVSGKTKTIKLNKFGLIDVD